MRHEKAAAVLRLARLMAASAEGVTLDEMARELAVDRRTAERMRDAVAELFPQMEAVPDPPTKRFRIPAGLDGFLQAPTIDELAALGAAAAEAQAQGQTVRAAGLRSLEGKVLSALRAPARRRMAPDLEALLQAEAIAVQAGPRPFADEGVLREVREALKAGSGLRFRYAGGSAPGRVREVAPFGLLFGRANYLVAAEAGGAPRTWRLDRMEAVARLETSAPRPVGFSLQAYVDRSFGIYQDEAELVVLRFSPAAADSALRWRFHVGQELSREADGGVIVSFTASGMRELAWHLITWGADVEVRAPDRLRVLVLEAARTAIETHGGPVAPTPS